jgi:ribosomal protein S18 acetylase RimI-like enzyme
MSAEPCYLLDWDTQHFGFAVAQVTDPLLTPQRAEQIDHWCLENRIKCLYFRATADDPQTTALAQQHGFRLVDVRTTLHRKLEDTFRPRTIACRIREPIEADFAALEDLAVSCHRNTRFYYDGRFPIDRCEQLYRTWMRRDLLWSSGVHPKRPDASTGRNLQCNVAVVQAEGQIAGYSTCYESGPGHSGFISLMAVAPEFRHRGIGNDLIHASLQWLMEKNASGASVTTQGWNVGALRVYQRCGFHIALVDLMWHKWFD